MYDMRDRVAIVTGSGGGIGRAIALRLASEGCDIGVFDIGEAGARETAELVRALGRNTAIAVGNVARREEVSRGVGQMAHELGPIDILVNNAGILRTGPFLAVTEADWRDTLGVNLDGTFHFCQAVLPGMIERRRGNVVNMSSWVGKKGVPNHAAYSASKFAVIGLTQSIAGEVAGLGVRVNAVCPGIIVDTQMRIVAEESNKRHGLPDVTERAKAIPMGRVGVPDDIARVVAFLASDESSYMTGQAINITGGLWT